MATSVVERGAASGEMSPLELLRGIGRAAGVDDICRVDCGEHGMMDMRCLTLWAGLEAAGYSTEFSLRLTGAISRLMHESEWEVCCGVDQCSITVPGNAAAPKKTLFSFSESGSEFGPVRGDKIVRLKEQRQSRGKETVTTALFLYTEDKRRINLRAQREADRVVKVEISSQPIRERRGASV